MLCQFVQYSEVNQIYIYICISPLCHHRVLNRVPCAIQQVLTGYLFYTFYTQQRLDVNSNLPIHPTPLPSLVFICLCSYFCFFCLANRFICTIFLDSTIHLNTFNSYREILLSQLLEAHDYIAHHSSMEFSRQECESGQPFPSPGNLPNLGIEPGSPALQADSLPSEPPGSPFEAQVRNLEVMISNLLS